MLCWGFPCLEVDSNKAAMRKPKPDWVCRHHWCLGANDRYQWPFAMSWDKMLFCLTGGLRTHSVNVKGSSFQIKLWIRSSRFKKRCARQRDFPKLDFLRRGANKDSVTALFRTRVSSAEGENFKHVAWLTPAEERPERCDRRCRKRRLSKHSCRSYQQPLGGRRLETL